MSFRIPCDLLDRLDVENFVPNAEVGNKYKYRVLGADGILREKTDPFGWYFEPPMGNASIICQRKESKTQAQYNSINPREMPFPFMKCISVRGGTTRITTAHSLISNWLNNCHNTLKKTDLLMWSFFLLVSTLTVHPGDTRLLGIMPLPVDLALQKNLRN